MSCGSSNQVPESPKAPYVVTDLPFILIFGADVSTNPPSIAPDESKRTELATLTKSLPITYKYAGK